MKLSRLSAVLAATLALWALAPVAPRAQVRLPALGESVSDDFSVGAEHKLGEQIMREIRRDPDYVDDPQLHDYLETIWQPLVKSARERGEIGADTESLYAWEPFLVRDRSVNAFALPGGYVGVHLGLMAITNTRDELAAVLAHELSHVTQRHIARSMVNASRQSLLGMAAMILGAVAAGRSGNVDATQAVIVGSQAAMAQGQLNFSRDMEREADRVGYGVLGGAGFSPSGVGSMFEKLEHASRLNDNGSYPYLRSHPLTTERIGEARSRASVGKPVPQSSPLWHVVMQARARVLKTVRFFRDAPQGSAATGAAGYNGFFYRYLDMKTGHRVGDIELSTVDTALLLGGMLFCQSYFDGQDAEEAEIRQGVEEIYGRVNWRWAQVRGAAIVHGWTPEGSFLEYDWRGYNEAMLVYLLALGSPSHGVAAAAWNEWTRDYDKLWGPLYGQTHLRFESHFGHQYSHVWVDFRGITDQAMRKLGIDYFENSRRATYAQRAYAIANPMRWAGYGDNVWGLTASDGSADVEAQYAGEKRRFRTYYARGVGPDPADDGTIAPTAAAASLPFAPEIVIPAIEEMHRRYGEHIYGQYGFYDAFNPSFDYDMPLRHGRRIPGVGWVDSDYLGIDQGPIVAMIENHRSDLVWRTMRKNPHIKRGLLRAGFTGGWLDASSPTLAKADAD